MKRRKRKFLTKNDLEMLKYLIIEGGNSQKWDEKSKQHLYAGVKNLYDSEANVDDLPF